MILRNEFIILIVALFFQKSLAQQPSVPCPSIFQYSRSGDKQIGFITVNKVTYGETKVEIELSQSGSINSDYGGDLQLNFDKDKIFDYIKSGEAVTYRVDFARQDVIPQVSAIRVNGVQICFGKQVSAPSTTVTLTHTLTAPHPSGTSQESTPPKWIPSAAKSLPWSMPRTSPRPNFGFPNFLSSTLTKPKETSKDSSNPFFKGNNEFHYVFTIPSTTTTTERTYYNEQNPPAFLHTIRPTTSTTTTTTTTTTSTTTTTTPRPTFKFIPRSDPPNFIQQSNPMSNFIPQPVPASNFNPPLIETPFRLVPQSVGWNYINSVCGRENFNFTVKKLAVNGEIVPRARFPWIVALFKKNVGSLKFQCGGSLITTRTVISAAHCFYTGFNRIKDEDILVSLGRHNLTDWSDSYIVHSDVEKIIQHPDYRPELVNIDADLAIILLKTSVTFSLAIRPVCLWRGRLNVDEIEGVPGIVVGWGRDEENNDVTTGPRLVTANVVSELTCVRSDTRLVALTSNRTLCAGNRDGSGPCNGDSGSGLMIRGRNKWMLRGTVSAALSSDVNPCNLDEYVIYTDIAQFLGWIYANSV